nr:hypothetical protein [Tanacetum cinerariifolium]
YVADSDPDEDPEEDPEDDHVDYPADGGDGDDEPSDDYDDDDDTDDEDGEPFEDEEDGEEEEHLALADSSVVPIVDPVLPAGDTKALEAEGLPYHSCSRIRGRKSSTAGATRQPGPTKSNLRRYRVEQAGYGITDTWDEIVDTLMEIAPTTLERVDQRVTELDTTVRQRIDEFEIRFEEAQDERAILRAYVNTLFRDRPDHCHTAMLLDREAMYSREAWAGSEDRSAAIAAHVRILEAHVVALIAQTSSLQTQLTTTLGHIEILEARDPEPQEGQLRLAATVSLTLFVAILYSILSFMPQLALP